MQLSFKKMPVLLRALTWLLLFDGVMRIVRWLITQFWGEPEPLRRLVIGALFAYAAVQLRRGLRQAIDWLLIYTLAQVGIMTYAGVLAERSLLPRHWVGWSLAVGLAGYLLWCRQRLPWREPGSFEHWMSDPDVRGNVAEWFAMRDEIVKQDRLDPPDPDEVIGQLLEGGDAELVRQRVIAQRGHFGMAVMRALGNPAFRRDADSLAMLIDNLPESLRTRARPHLVECVDHLTGFQRGNLMRLLASAGTDDLAPLIVRELGGEEGSMVAEGLKDAARENRLSEELFVAVEPALRECLEDPDRSQYAAVVLALHDRALATQLIRDGQDFADAPLRGIVELAESGIDLPADEMLALWRRAHEQREWFWCWRLQEHVKVPEPELRELLKQLPEHFGDAAAYADWQEAHGMGPKYSRLCYARGLEALVASHGGEVEGLLREAIDMELDEVSDAASALLAQVYGAPRGFGYHDLPEGTELSRRQRELRSLAYADSFACNGGLVHAFDCLDADAMEVLESALYEIAPPVIRDIWLAAMREVSPEPLPVAEDERREFLQGRYDDVCERLDELSSEYFRENWRLTVAVDLYAIEHRDELGDGTMSR